MKSEPMFLVSNNANFTTIQSIAFKLILVRANSLKYIDFFNSLSILNTIY